MSNSKRDRVIELHDSELISTLIDKSNAILNLVVMLHVSHGIPGSDSGSVWTQPADLKIKGATIESTLGNKSLNIIDGKITIEKKVFNNILPIPFDYTGKVVVEFSGLEGSIKVEGKGIKLTLHGKADYLEEILG
jgi:hypothetical protein